MVTEGAQVKRKKGGSRVDSHWRPASDWWQWLTGEGDGWASQRGWWWCRGSLTQLYLQQLQNSHICKYVHILTHAHTDTHAQSHSCDVGCHLPSWWLPPCWKGSSLRGHFLCDCHECSLSISRQHAVPKPANSYAQIKIPSYTKIYLPSIELTSTTSHEEKTVILEDLVV